MVKLAPKIEKKVRFEFENDLSTSQFQKRSTWAKFIENLKVKRNDYDCKYKYYFAIIMILVAVGEASFLYVQAEQNYRTKSAKDISRTSVSILLTTSFLWIMYSFFVTHDSAIFVSGVLYFIGAIVLLVASLLYG